MTLSGRMPDMAARAIGYRQTLDYLTGGGNDNNDQRKESSSSTTTTTTTTTTATTEEEDRFNSYIDEFTTATRRYAKKQMSWFRKDKDFMFIPVSLKLDKVDRVKDAASMIQNYCQLSREEYEKELFATTTTTTTEGGEGSNSSSSVSATTKARNQEQGKLMKFYKFERHILKPGTKEYIDCFSKAIECRKRMQQNKKARIEE